MLLTEHRRNRRSACPCATYPLQTPHGQSLESSQDSDSITAGRSGIQISEGAREFFSVPNLPDRLWVPPSLMWWTTSFPQQCSGSGVMLTIHSHLVPRLYQRSYTSSPIHFLRALDRENCTARGLYPNLRSNRLSTNHLCFCFCCRFSCCSQTIMMEKQNNKEIGDKVMVIPFKSFWS